MGTAHNIIRTAYKKGIRLLGAGCYSAVMDYSKDTVLKIGADMSDPYLHFLENIEKINNPHFPRVQDIYIDVKHSFYLVKLEKLYSLSEATLTTRYPSLYDWVFKEKPIPTWASDKMIEAVNYLLTMTDYKNFSDAANKEKEGLTIDLDSCKLDLHESNIMEREDGTLVFTDPLCNCIMYDVPDLEAWVKLELKVAECSAAW